MITALCAVAGLLQACILQAEALGNILILILTSKGPIADRFLKRPSIHGPPLRIGLGIVSLLVLLSPLD